MEVSKQDWKLFRERLPGWQEAYMERLCREYIELLRQDEPASSRFWGLHDRIKEDRRLPGVRMTLNKRNLPYDLQRLIYDEVITMDDLDGFSQELRETVQYLIRSASAWNESLS